MIFHQPHNSKCSNNYNAYFYTSEAWDFHFHKNLELIYVVKGSVKCIINNTTYILMDGDYGLCMPYDIHSYIPDKDTLYWVGVFSEDYVRLFANQIRGKSPEGFVFKCPEATDRLLKSTLISTEVPSVYILKSCLYAVCDAFLTTVSFSENISDKKINILLIAEYISNNHTKNITLNDISKLLGYDYNYVSRYFHSAFNMSFTDFLNIYRLETAIRLLDETDKKITEIALESGFQSIRSFNNSFRLKFKISPSEYKRNKFINIKNQLSF